MYMHVYILNIYSPFVFLNLSSRCILHLVGQTVAHCGDLCISTTELTRQKVI